MIMINLSKEMLDLLLICINKNLPVREFVADGPEPTVPITNPIQYREKLIERILDPDFDGYTMEFYNTLRLIVNDEFLGPRWNAADSEPNEYGLKLDRLIGELGRLVFKIELKGSSWYHKKNIFGGQYMNQNNWYISLDYDYADTDKTMKILEVLDYKKHKVLYGQGKREMTENEQIKDINDYFFDYLMETLDLSCITDMNEFENRLRKIFLKKYGTNKENIDFINEGKFSINKLLDKFKDIDKQTLWELKCTFYNLVSLTSDIYSDKIRTVDKIRFSEAEDISFFFKYKVRKYMYTWYEINNDTDLKNIILTDNLDLIITDDLNDISNYIYYVNINWISGGGRTLYEPVVEEKNSTTESCYSWSIAIHDKQNKLGELVNTKLLDICSEEHQFTNFNPTKIKFI